MTSRVSAVRPALRSRLAFYLWGHRVGRQYDAWVRDQVERPSFPLRSLAVVYAGYLSAILVLALVTDLPLYGVVPLYVGILGIQLLPGMRERNVRRTLARQGLTPSRPVLAPWHRAGRLGGAVVLGLVPTLAVGLVVVTDDLEERRRCPRVPTSTADAISALVASDTASVPPWKGAELHTFRQVSIGEGQHRVAALVRLRDEDFGPATWRALDPHSPRNESDRLRVEAVPGLAAEITPSLGTYSQDPLPYDAIRVTNCVV